MPQRLCFLTKPFYFHIASIPSVPLPDLWSKLSSQAWITGSQFIFWSPSHPVDCLIDFTGCPLKSKFLTTEYQTWPCPAASLTSAAPFNQSSPDPKCHPQWVHSPWLSPSQIPSALMHPPGHSSHHHVRSSTLLCIFTCWPYFPKLTRVH